MSITLSPSSHRSQFKLSNQDGGGGRTRPVFLAIYYVDSRLSATKSNQNL